MASQLDRRRDGARAEAFWYSVTRPSKKLCFLFDVHHLGEPGEGVGDGFVERGEAAGGEAAVGDVVDVGARNRRS